MRADDGRWVAFAISVVVAALTPISASAQATAEMEPAVAKAFDFELSIANVMRGTELVGGAPTGVSWTDDSEWIYFQWLPGGQDWFESSDLYRVRATGGEPELISEEAADSLAVRFAAGDISNDGRWRVSSVGGDLYLVDRRSMAARRLTRTNDSESAPTFSADGNRIFFRVGDNLLSLTLGDGSIRQLTDIRTGQAPADEVDAEGLQGFLEEQQRELFEHVRVQQQQNEERDASRERHEAQSPTPTYVGQRDRVGSLTPTRNGDYVTVTVVSQAEGAQGTIVPSWVTEGGYTEELRVRAKVGDAQSDPRMGLLEVATGEMTWIDAWPADSSNTSEDGESTGGSDTPKLAGGGFWGWNEAGTHALLAAIAYDYKEWRLYSLEAATGELTLLDSVQDEAWVGGPCFTFNGPCAGWIPGTDRAYYVSEATGWAHIYTINVDGSDRRALTGGDWEIRSVSIPSGWDRFLIHSSESSAYNTLAYRMDFDGSDRDLLLEGDGIFQVTPSPDGDRLAAVYSRSNRPGELYVAGGRPGSDMEQVTVSPVADWLTFPWKAAEILTFKADDGTDVPARIYRPQDLGAQPNGAGVVFVHGAGYLQNVHNGWSGYFREYMFNHLLAAQGYVVLDIDYRGSAGHGGDWRTATYRWMGGKDLSDQVDGARYLIENEGVEPGRLGLYGGSYGGFITLMALFTEPGTFEAGAALRSVTDWAHYNHWYTGRILNEPQNDDEAYRRSSPIYFAEGLEGHLLIAHGMVDTNVHFQDVVRLAQRLIELGKENWEMAVYPVESHGFVQPTSWTDEYRRIYELFDRTIGSRPPNRGTGG